MAKINPFNPNSPLPPSMFVGRIDEVTRLETILFQVKNGLPSNFIITGERGIGKTSLLMYTEIIAKGQINVLDDIALNFIVININIDKNTSRYGLIKKIEMGLERELDKSEPTKKLLKNAWEFLTKIEAAGFRIHDEKTTSISDEILLEEFSYSIGDILKNLCESGENNGSSKKYDGILILIDEADNSNQDLNLGSFIKILSEQLIRRGCPKLIFGLAGLNSLHQILRTSHQSVLRIFEEFTLDKLSREETNRVIDLALERAGKMNGIKTTIEDEARSTIFSLSEGYPHFIQQFGFSAFQEDKDDNINNDDVLSGAAGEFGALRMIGNRYYADDYFYKIRNEKYREVLKIMSAKYGRDGWVKKSEIREDFKGSNTTLDNAIKALRDRSIIISKIGERGIYKLQNMGFALWIDLTSKYHEKN